MTIFASCGHPIEDMDDLIHIEYDDETIDYDAGCFVPTLVTGVYCPKCASSGIADGWLRPHSRT